jgi:hypothetical protein
MTGTPFLDYVALHCNAADRQGPSLVNWAKSWFSCADTPLVLTPNDWFTRGHTHSTCIWIPPPADGDVALEQMALSIHKRPKHTHLILIPRLFTSRWWKYLEKVCNLIFTIPLGSEIWYLTNFEPLIAGIYLPLSRHKPWNLRGTPMLERVERMLHEMPPSDPRWGRSVLRELLFQARSLETMSSSMVRPCYTPIDNSEFPIALPTNEDGLVNEEVKWSKRYLAARNGDNLCTPFQCDFCHFRNLMHRDPQPSLAQDLGVLKCI